MSDSALRLRAMMLADRIDTRGLERTDSDTGVDPLAMRYGANGRVFVFREGACVFLGFAPEEEADFLSTLESRLRNPLPKAASEDVGLVVREGVEEGVQPDGLLALHGLDAPRLAVVADVLAKAASLNYYEEIIQHAVEGAEPFAHDLARTGRPGVDLDELNRRMGAALVVQHRLVGRMAVAEKPDVLWDHPEFERLYARLEVEYELRDRALEIDNRLELLRNSSSVITDLIQNERGRRLEWIIIALIAFEIMLSLYTLLSGAPH